MTLVGEPPRAANIVERAKGLILKPAIEWAVIDAEPASVRGLFTGYVCILAAVPAVAGVIGSMLTAVPMLGIVGPAYLVGRVVWGVISYGLALAGVWIVGVIINALASSFDGTPDKVQAFKVSAYFPTAAWVAGIATVIPLLGWLVALAGAIYSLYLLYLGLPRLMRVPADKALVYTVVAVLAAVVIQWFFIWFAAVAVLMFGLGGLGAAAMGAGMFH